MTTERAEDKLFEDLEIVVADPATLRPPTEKRPTRDPLARLVLALDESVDRIFFDPNTRPNPPMLVHLPFEGGYIDIFRTPIKGVVFTTLSIDGRESRFSRCNDAHGEIGSVSYTSPVTDLTGAGSIGKIVEDLGKAGPRIAVALSQLPEGAHVLYKPTSV